MFVDVVLSLGQQRQKKPFVFGLTYSLLDPSLATIWPFRLPSDPILDPKYDKKIFRMNDFIHSVSLLRLVGG